MKKLLIHFYLLLTIHGGSAALAQGHSTSETTRVETAFSEQPANPNVSAGSFLARIQDQRASSQAFIELHRMLSSANPAESDQAKSIIRSCWTSRSPQVRAVILPLYCSPKSAVPNLNIDLLTVLNQETDLNLLDAVGRSLDVVKLTDGDFLSFLQSAKNISERNTDVHTLDGYAHSHAPQVALMILHGLAISRGPSGARLIQDFLAQNPRMFGLYGAFEWTSILLDTNNPDIFNTEFAKMLRQNTYSDQEKATIVLALSHAYAYCMQDESLRTKISPDSNTFGAFLHSIVGDAKQAAVIRENALFAFLQLGLSMPDCASEALQCAKENEVIINSTPKKDIMRSLIEKIEKAGGTSKK